ncbi:MAG: CPBP family intramembrane metalloprotease [Bacteroidales bacterium]|nr:CPBP family intramembrane metalloprotease [Bacteroidales bacterium]
MKAIFDKNLKISIAVAAILWFLMFNPWMGLQQWFWPIMAASSAILLFMAFRYGRIEIKFDFTQIVMGIAIAALLWGCFWVGDKVSGLIFNFSRMEINQIYSMGDGWPKWAIALQLLFLTGPAEEIFWRGFIQKRIGSKFGATGAFFITLSIYTFIHIWSFNFMLVMAAMVAGALWGALYWWKPNSLGALVISHALWDAVIFVFIPV